MCLCHSFAMEYVTSRVPTTELITYSTNNSKQTQRQNPKPEKSYISLNTLCLAVARDFQGDVFEQLVSYHVLGKLLQAQGITETVFLEELFVVSSLNNSHPVR